MIPYGRQIITKEDIREVIDVLNSDFLTQGPKVPLFEEAITQYTKAKYAIAVNSATSALHLGCLALNLGAGDYLWTSAISFVASANCALYCQANVEFIDIDYETNNICMNALEEKLLSATRNGKLPKIVVAVHMAGQSCDMRRLFALSKIYNFKIIEDASHAVGAKYLGNFIGGCQYSDITIFSFHPVKIITTGEGGMALTNSESLAYKIKLLRSHGITKEKAFLIDQDRDGWYYEQTELGYNYRMSDIQAALGLSQLKRVDFYVERRMKLFDRYQDILKSTKFILPKLSSDSYSSNHLYIIKIISEGKTSNRDFVYKKLINSGIGVNLHYMPIYKQPYYVKKYGEIFLPNSEKYFNTALTLPLYPGMSYEDQDFICQELIHSLSDH